MIADLEGWGQLVFEGRDRRNFLNGLLTSDVLSLSPGKGQRTLVLTPKGMLVADFALYDRGDELLAVSPPQSTAPIAKALTKSIVLSETKLKDESEASGLLFIAGSDVAAKLKTVLGPVPELSAWGCAWLEWKGAAVGLLSYPLWLKDGLLLAAPAGKKEEVKKALLGAGFTPAGRDALEVARVEAGVPAFGIDIDGTTLPLEANLEPAISFTKGCYLGQETTARSKDVGHVNRRLAVLRLEGKAEPGSVLVHEGREVGRLSSVVDSMQAAGPLGLALVRVDAAKPGTCLEVRYEGAKTSAEVIDPPSSPSPTRGEGV